MWKKIKDITHEGIPFFFGAPVLIWQVLFLCVPLLLIIGLSIVSRDAAGLYRISLEPIASFMEPMFWRIMLWSGTLALFTAVVCLVISYPISYIIAFKAGRYKIPLLFLLIVPFWTNFLLHVYAWFFVLERGGFLNTLLLKTGIISEPLRILNTPTAIVIMMIYSYLPFMILPLYAVFDRFDTEYIEASMDLGASWLQTVRKVIIPLTFTGIISGFFLVFIPSFAEFAIPELMGGDRRMFVGTVISQYMLGALTFVKGAAFTLLSSLVLSVLVMAIYYVMRGVVKRL